MKIFIPLFCFVPLVCANEHQDQYQNINDIGDNLSNTWMKHWLFWVKKAPVHDTWNELFGVGRTTDDSKFQDSVIRLAIETHIMADALKNATLKILPVIHSIDRSIVSNWNQTGKLNARLYAAENEISEKGILCQEHMATINRLLNSSQELDQVKESIIDLDNKMDNFSAEIKKVFIVGILSFCAFLVAFMAIGFTILIRINKKTVVKDSVPQKPGANKATSLAMSEMWDNTYDYVDPAAEEINSRK